MEEGINDVWIVSFKVEQKGFYYYKVFGWIDYFLYWYDGFFKKKEVGQDMKVEFKIGVGFFCCVVV